MWNKASLHLPVLQRNIRTRRKERKKQRKNERINEKEKAKKRRRRKKETLVIFIIAMKRTVKCLLKLCELMVRWVTSIAGIRDCSSETHQGKDTACQDTVHVGTKDSATRRSHKFQVENLLLNASVPTDNDSED